MSESRISTNAAELKRLRDENIELKECVRQLQERISRAHQHALVAADLTRGIRPTVREDSA